MASTYRLIYDPEVARHLEAVERKYRQMIRDTILELLAHTPLEETRNRKPLRGPTSLGEVLWEIRFGPANRFREFYDADDESRTVVVRAVGVKRGSRLWIGSKEVEP